MAPSKKSKFLIPEMDKLLLGIQLTVPVLLDFIFCIFSIGVIHFKKIKCACLALN